MNAPRTLDPGAVRACCIVLAVGFSSMVLLRALRTGGATHVPERAAMIAYAVLGVAMAPRLGWYGLRAYTLGLALVLPLIASYVIGADGHRLADLPIAVLATFIPFIFLLAASDFVIASALLVVGLEVVFRHTPPPAVPLSTLWAMHLGAMAVGTAAGILLVAYRGLMDEGQQRWQQSYARERTLREFAETAAATTGESALALVAAAFARTLPDGACALLLGGADGAGLRIAAVGGLDLTPGTAPIAPPLGARIAAVGAGVLDAAQDGTLAVELRGLLHLPFTPTRVVVLPVNGLVRGVILLCPRHEVDVTEEALLMWQAMTHATAVVVANVNAWEVLRAQEADARRLAEERVALAETRARFVTQASHEFRTPLAVIRAAMENVRRYGDRMTPAQREQRFTTVDLAIDDMTGLLDDVLVLGRTESGADPCQPERTDVAALCRTVLEEIALTVDRTHDLVVEAAADRLVADVDPRLVRQIVRNLVSNAVKYSPHGGRVTLGLRRADGKVVLQVSDQGIGIAPEDQPHLFEAFRRGRNVGSIGGSGLGLAITQRAVELHHGAIRVVSAVGGGATFTVELPGADADADPAGRCG